MELFLKLELDLIVKKKNDYFICHINNIYFIILTMSKNLHIDRLREGKELASACNKAKLALLGDEHYLEDCFTIFMDDGKTPESKTADPEYERKVILARARTNLKLAEHVRDTAMKNYRQAMRKKESQDTLDRLDQKFNKAQEMVDFVRKEFDETVVLLMN